MELPQITKSQKLQTKKIKIIKTEIKKKLNMLPHTLKATWDLLVFLILMALLTCLPGSSAQDSKEIRNKLCNIRISKSTNHIEYYNKKVIKKN